MAGGIESEPLDEVLWRAPEWIQMFGLRTDNVLEYFSQSPFYDRSSNNQVLKMQSQFNENLHGRLDLSAELKNMQGIEFVIALAKEPEMWVIRKQNRLSPHEAKQLATYFVIGENIFMAPNVYSVVSSRLLSTVLSLNKALSKAVTLPTYSPSQGYSYIDDTSSLTTDDSSATPKPSSTATASSKQGTKSNYPSPMPSSTSSSQTPGNSQNINNNIPIPSVDDRLSHFHMDRALAYSMSNSTVYLDSAELGSAAIVSDSSQSKQTPTTAAGTPQLRRPTPRKK